MRWPWKWTMNGHDQHEVEAAEARAAELEDRSERIADRLTDQDPWAGRVLDTIRNPGEPHAR